MCSLHVGLERRVDEHTLYIALLAKGLVPGSSKWSAVRYRIQHRFMVTA